MLEAGERFHDSREELTSATSRHHHHHHHHYHHHHHHHHHQLALFAQLKENYYPLLEGQRGCATTHSHQASHLTPAWTPLPRRETPAAAAAAAAICDPSTTPAGPTTMTPNAESGRSDDLHGPLRASRGRATSRAANGVVGGSFASWSCPGESSSGSVVVPAEGASVVPAGTSSFRLRDVPPPPKHTQTHSHREITRTRAGGEGSSMARQSHSQGTLQGRTGTTEAVAGTCKQTAEGRSGSWTAAWLLSFLSPPHRRTKKSSRRGGGGGGGGGGNSGFLALPRRPTSSCKLFLASFLVLLSVFAPAEGGNPDAKRLYDDLLSNYNKLVRPVVNVTDVLTVRIKLKLSQLIDVNLKNQIMTTNLWVEQYWYDYKLIWEPKEYGGVEMLHVPSDHIWRPDIVLYNNADGNFEVTLSTKATLSFNGLVEWKPPAIYKSSCEIDVEYFPFDEQTCVMKFGSWTYDGFQVDLRHLDEVQGTNVVDLGVDLSEFYMSVEWDILEVPAVRHEKFYTCCDEPYLDITFNITMRRKTLFYTVNLIIPCMGISFLTVLTFYLPSDSGEKVTLSISILISLHVFFLLVVEIIPPTSLVVPLLGKYLIFAMILVSISICVTVLVLNVHFRSPQTHKMAPWVRRVFIHILPRLLIMKRPQYQHNKHSSLKSEFKSLWNPAESDKSPLNSVFMESNRVMVRTCNGNEMRENFFRGSFDEPIYKHSDNPNLPYDTSLPRDDFSPITDGPFTTCRIHGATTIHDDTYAHNLPHCSPEVHRTCWCVNFIAEHTRLKEDSTKVKEDWKYVAMVLDRLFLWIFTLAVLVGTAGIILQAPSLYDDRVPLDKMLSEVFRPHR